MIGLVELIAAACRALPRLATLPAPQRSAAMRLPVPGRAAARRLDDWRTADGAPRRACGRAPARGVADRIADMARAGPE